MTWLSFYQEAKGWQTVIGSVLGFAGLISGALFNAELNRRRDDRLRNAEAITIALSLYGEITLLRENLAKIARTLSAWYVERGAYHQDIPGYFRDILPTREPILYNTIAHKLGFLNPEILLPITNFYSDYESSIGHIPKLFKSEENKLTYGPEWVIEPAISAIKGIEPCLRRIEKLGRISPGATTPSIGQAESAIELIESMRPDNQE